MRSLRFLDERIEEIILVLLFSATSLLTFLQVIMRYIVKSPLSWSEELSRYMFIWLIYIGVSYGVKKSAHIKIDVLMNIFPKSFRKYIVLLSDVIFIGFSLLIVVTGIQNASKIFSLGQVSPGLGIQMGFVYLAPVIGFGLTIIRLIQNLVNSVKINPELPGIDMGGD